MSHHPSFDSVNAWLNYLEKPTKIQLGLTRVQAVKKQLNIHFDCPVFTVAGTNGKGSSCALLEAILVHAGYRVSCHTSPHLLHFNERARLNGVIANDQMLLPHFEAVDDAVQTCALSEPLTYFEWTTLVILHFFAHSNPEVVILEIGLGGRYDAMNIINSSCAIITSIALDHVDLLGETREAIGFEKAGIFRKHCPAICGEPDPIASIIDYAHTIEADLWQRSKDFDYQTSLENQRRQWHYQGRQIRYHNLPYPSLQGQNQLMNAATVLAALESMRDSVPVSVQHIRQGLLNAFIPGRFQILPGKPVVILDVAHNLHGIQALKRNLQQMPYHPRTLAVFGVMADKDIAAMLTVINTEIDQWYLTDLPVARAARAEELQTYLNKISARNEVKTPYRCFSSPQHAYTQARQNAQEHDRILIFGSFYTVAEILKSRNTTQN